MNERGPFWLWFEADVNNIVGVWPLPTYVTAASKLALNHIIMLSYCRLGRLYTIHGDPLPANNTSTVDISRIR